MVVQAVHDALNAGSIRAFLDLVTDDFVYESNARPAKPGQVTMVGKAEFEDFWTPVFEVVSTHTVPEQLKLDGDIARLRMTATVTNRATGMTLEENYRQTIVFRGRLISRITEVHDAAKLNSFCQLLMSENQKT